MHRGTPFERRDLFGGTGTVTIWNLLGNQAMPPFTAVLSCELEAGGRVGAHVQEHHPEIVIGTGGEGVVLVDGVSAPLRSGVVAHLPLGSVLELRNPGTEPLGYLIIKAQASE